MNSSDDERPTTSGRLASDQSLVELTRTGDHRAFAELWRRHFRSGARVARQFTSSIDADDLVSEAYTRIYQRVLAGGGPTGAFRPYLYTTIRNLASTWGAAAQHVQVDDLADFEDPATLDDPAAGALDRTLTARAFRSLPERWQSVLWYTEVEGMDPHEVAPVLGMTANGVAALSYRAREGLRKAWLQAHVNDATTTGQCRWTISRIGEHARNALTLRDTGRLDAHLAVCARCAIISEEVDEVGSRLAFVMLPILLGGVAGGAMLASYGSAGSAVAAGAIPAVPVAIGTGAISSGAAISTTTGAAGAFGFFGVSAAPMAVVGTLALVMAVSGSALTFGPAGSGSAPDSISSATDANVSAPPLDGTPQAPGPGEGGSAGLVVRPDDPANLGGPLTRPVDDSNVLGQTPAAEVLGGVDGILDGTTGAAASVVGSVVESVGAVASAVTGGAVVADLSLTLAGTATPGAHLSLQVAGQVYATTTVDSSGQWMIGSTVVPGGLGSIELVQRVDRGYLRTTLPGGGILATLLGTVDGLIDALVRPIHISSGDSGIIITLLG